MRAPFAYYGGKARLADRIVAALPPHRLYVEPFFGSGAVFFAKQPSTQEVVNDVDGAIVNFFRVVRDRPYDLIAACEATPYARDEYVAATDDVDLDDLERARRLWVRIVQNFRHTATPPTRGDWSFSIDPANRKAALAQGMVERFMPCARRLTGTIIENTDAVTLINKIDDADALFYVDPPYLGETRSAGERYHHDLLTDADHVALADALRSRPGQVALSGYRSDLYDALYADWFVTETRISTVAGNASHADRTEVLWTNYDPHAGRLFGGAA